MALYIDFNFINIRDLIDLSMVDLEFENQLEGLIEEIFENPLESELGGAEYGFGSAAIDFLSEIMAESETSSSGVKDVADVLAAPITAGPVNTAAPAKPANKTEAYIEYINNNYEPGQAEYFINVLLNPVQTHLRSRFDFADVRNSYLAARILGKDEETSEKADETRRRQDERLRRNEAERRLEALKRIELSRLLEQKSREQNNRV